MNYIASFISIVAASTFIPMTGNAFASDRTMVTTGLSSPPIGYVQFCKAHPDDCKTYDRPHLLVKLTRAAWSQLNTINTTVNTSILPATDMQVYGVLERWEYPKVAGDCEDFVLEKRRQLTTAGWPESALLITVVRDEAGDGHAVLTVRTDQGDVVLDNKTDRIALWNDTPYTYLKRESADSINAWDLIQDSRTALVGSVR